MKTPSAKRGLSYYTWPVGILLFFAAIIAVNMTLLTLATSSSSRSRLIEDQPYERGLEFQKVVDARERFKALGWALAVSVRDGRLEARLTDRDGVGVPGANVILKAIHPAKPEGDRHLELLEAASNPGLYTTEFSGPDVRWLLRFTIRVGELTVKDEQTL